jgi:guanosine-diphosphatase
MKGHIIMHKSVGGVSRVVLAVCIGVLLIVFVTAYGVGTSTANPRKARLLADNEKLLERRRTEVTKCEERRVTYQNGDKITTEQAVKDLEHQKAAAQDELRMEKERIASIRFVVQGCKESVDELRKRAFGASAANITSHLAELERKREQLIEQHDALTNMKEMHRRRDLIALQRALVQQLVEANRQERDTERIKACVSSPVKYSVVFDLGSSGNRVHVYKYTAKALGEGDAAATTTTSVPLGDFATAVPMAGGAAKQRDLISEINLTEELFKVNYRALSKLPNPLEEAPGALRELFDDAKAFVPADVHHCTPVEFKATAGLRMLGAEKAAEILSAIRRVYRNETFWMRGSAPVRILDGSEEGPMAWLTVNFLLGAFDKNSGSSTVAVIDLGGGSTQIVFEPHEDTFGKVPSYQQFNAQLGSRAVRAYQHSYEGFGLHSATQELLYNIQGKCQPKPAKPTAAPTTSTAAPAGQQQQQQQDEGLLNTLFGDGDAEGDVDDDEDQIEEAEVDPPLDPVAMEAFPCFAVGYSDPVGVSNTKMTEAGTPVTQPNFTACVALFSDRLLRPAEVPCPDGTHCGIGKTYQPPLAHFKGDIYAFSFIFDLLEQANATSLAVSSDKFEAKLYDFAEVGTRRCAALTVDAIRNAKPSGSLKPAYDCMYYSYIYALLRDGYGIPQDRLLHVAKKIKGYETAWTLGASLISLV